MFFRYIRAGSLPAYIYILIYSHFQNISVYSAITTTNVTTVICSYHCQYMLVYTSVPTSGTCRYNRLFSRLVYVCIFNHINFQYVSVYSAVQTFGIYRHTQSICIFGHYYFQYILVYSVILIPLYVDIFDPSKFQVIY